MPPNKDFEISFQPLLEGVVYQVNCEIKSNHQSNLNNDFIALYSDDDLHPIINGIPLKNNWQTTISSINPNRLTLTHITSNSSFVIRNLDDVDTITIDGCFALPEV